MTDERQNLIYDILERYINEFNPDIQISFTIWATIEEWDILMSMFPPEKRTSIHAIKLPLHIVVWSPW